MIGIAIDAILVLVVVEGLGLVLFNRVTGRGPAARTIPAMLAAGFFLMLAVRLALAGAGELWLAACFLAALVAHLLDLAGRWRN